MKIRKSVSGAPTWLLRLIDTPVHLAPARLSLSLHNIDLIYEICLELEFRSAFPTDDKEGV